MSVNTRGTVLDESSKAMLYAGLNMTELGLAFKMDTATIREMIHDVPPDGSRRGSPIWKIASVKDKVARLTAEQIDYKIRTMHHSLLPKMLTKEFWAGLRAKQDVEIRDGDLWRTAHVVAEMSEVFKIFKMRLVLMADQIDRLHEMTDAQKAECKRLTDTVLNETYSEIIQRFSPKKNVRPTEDEEL